MPERVCLNNRHSRLASGKVGAIVAHLLIQLRETGLELQNSQKVNYFQPNPGIGGKYVKKSTGAEKL